MRPLLLAALFSLSGAVLAAPCALPQLEALDLKAHKAPVSSTLLEVDMRPVAILHLPAAFSRIRALPGGGVGLIGRDGGSIFLGFETRISRSMDRKSLTPARLMRSLFEGADPDACQFREDYHLDDQDYRLKVNLGSKIRADLGQGAVLFAYGKGHRHQFHLIREDKPDFVLTGLFENMTRSEFEAVISAISIE